MKRLAGILALVTCLSLLGMQLSGLHMHVDSQGYSGAPHGTHVHEGGTDPHDHEHETDVNAVELGTIGSKQLFFLIAVVLAVVMVFDFSQRFVLGTVPVFLPGRRLRWRPPLRAPPAPLPLRIS